MTEAQIVIGIMQNDSRAWQYICRNMKVGFTSIVIQAFPQNQSIRGEVDDLFQESCVILMEKVKKGEVTLSREGALFSYLVQIGKLLACNFVRKRKGFTPEEFLDKIFDSIPEDCQRLLKNFSSRASMYSSLSISFPPTFGF